MSDLLEQIGNKLKAIRLEQNRTVDEVAQNSGLSNTYLWQMERGEVNFSIKKLESVCQALNIEVEDLFQKQEKNSSKNEELIKKIIILCRDKTERDLKAIIAFLKALD
ncbi:helix-turn-helix domain-containing protein [Paenibacillus naphthalenovorans]|uniref:Xre family transcriptional regulator n=1 Tax=Paenibacillus naphthalenovorans TaxID=162209 RepID=A0A0U2IMQ9_9BACL|nr:helix-turn-helix transcriptional regulator [Paenibacillus naphthalenovorans]ALS23179.1 Xre family transcriptional regulator [Paenibacillus naphthalenovorans]